MNSIEDMKLCLGKTVKRKIHNVEFEFGINDSDSIPDLLVLQTTAQELMKGKVTKAEKVKSLRKMMAKPDCMDALVRMMDSMVKNAVPEADEQLRKQFIMANFEELQGVFMELHAKEPETEKNKPIPITSSRSEDVKPDTNDKTQESTDT